MSAELDLLRRDQLTVYGAGWCADCASVRRHLDAEGVAYEYIDLASNPIAQSLLDSAGIRAIPVVVTSDGRVLIEPSTVELDAMLAARPAA